MDSKLYVQSPGQLYFWCQESPNRIGNYSSHRSMEISIINQLLQSLFNEAMRLSVAVHGGLAEHTE